MDQLPGQLIPAEVSPEPASVVVTPVETTTARMRWLLYSATQRTAPSGERTTPDGLLKPAAAPVHYLVSVPAGGGNAPVFSDAF